MEQTKDKEKEKKPEEQEEKPADFADGSDSLEGSSTVDETAQKSASKDAGGVTDTTGGENIKKKKREFKGISRIARLNIYMLAFIFLIVVAAVVTFVSYQRNKTEEAKKDSLLTEPLSQETLDKLRQSDVRVGDPKQILSIESNAIFSGKVLIRDSLEVAGQLKIGGPLNLPGITVSGASSFDQVKINNLDISGNTNIQGQLSVQKGITVGGNLSVSGNLSAGKLTLDGLQLNGDLSLSRHIDAGGGSPSFSPGGGCSGPLGCGGTTSLSGTDTAGTVNVNTGSSTGSGCFITVRFVNKFNSTPHVVITPVGSGAAGLNYYINRSNSEFSVCTTNAAGGGQSFAFDYIVID